MKYKFKPTLLLASGLLLVSGSMILPRYVQLPDFLRGSMLGVGLALEMIALAAIQKGKNVCVR
ncbi:MAG: hypothetical protein DI535_14505 [Citrobacter freundii]|nr:MAG: hypothetical protein DI535_14505 [Citrobacter freundii]